MLVNQFKNEVCKITDIIVTCTIELYMQINKTLLPIPSKFHYLFNLRDISKVFQGILMVKSHNLRDEETFAKLWVHECQRVFMDRLNSEDDRSFLRSLLMTLASKFKGSWQEDIVFQNRASDQPKNIFSMILNSDDPEKSYQGVSSWTKLLD
jgi:dynein heavy chain